MIENEREQQADIHERYNHMSIADSWRSFPFSNILSYYYLMEIQKTRKYYFENQKINTKMKNYYRKQKEISEIKIREK